MPEYRNIGFFGHRGQRLEEMGVSREALEGRIEDVLSGLHHHFAEDEEKGVRLLTGLADGVDRLAARVGDRLGYRRQCIVPGNLEADLDGIEQAEADFLERGAETILEIVGGEAGSETVSSEAYRIQMDAILAHSDLIIAVWDGEPPRGTTGGTVRAILSSAVQRIPLVWLHPREGSVRVLRLEALAEKRLESLRRHPQKLSESTFWEEVDGESLLTMLEAIPGLRRNRSEKRNKHGLPGQERSPRMYRKLLRKIQYSGKAVVGPIRRYAGFIDNFLQSFLSANWAKLRKAIRLCPTVKSFPDNDLHGFPKSLAVNQNAYQAIFSASDLMAGIQAGRQRSTIWLTFLLGALAVFSAAAGSVHGFPGNKLHIWGYVEVGAILAILWLVWIARWLRFHPQFLGARHLAEQLRYHVLLVPLLGRTGYLVQPRYELHWDKKQNEPFLAYGSWEDREFRAAFRELGLPCTESEGTNRVRLTDRVGEFHKCINDVIQDQQHYHRKKAQEYERLHRNMERLSIGLFSATGLAAISHILLHASWLVIITTSFPALGAALHGIANQLELRRLADKYNHVDERLVHYQDLLANVGKEPKWENLADLRWVATRVVELLAGETQGWRSLLRHNEASIPS